MPILKRYENIYVLKPQLDDVVVKNFICRIKGLIKNNGGKTIKVSYWGKRKLAWPRKKNDKGIFIQHKCVIPANFVREFKKRLTLEEEVLLYQIILVKNLGDSSQMVKNKEENRLETTENCEQVYNTFEHIAKKQYDLKRRE